MVEIKEVKTKRDLKKFADFPNKFYKDCEQYIPNFLHDDIEDWTKKNPASEYCESKCFLAYKDNKLVGRIGAILSHKANEKFHTKRMRFSQVDFIDDYEVSTALFNAVESWAKEKGCNEVHGPLGFTDLDREGMLVEGFDKRSLFFTYYNYPYYVEHLTKLGYIKDTDWIETLLDAENVPEEYNAKLEKISNYLMKREHLHLFKAKKRKDYGLVMKKVFELVNICYADLYGVVDLTDKQQSRFAKKFIPLVDPRFAYFVMNEKEELVAFGVMSLSCDKALKKHGGRLFPFGFIDVLRQVKKSDQLNLLLVAVRPDYQKVGINGILMSQAVINAKKYNVKVAETGPNLETNLNVLGQWKDFPHEVIKRRRCFVKKIY